MTASPVAEAQDVCASDPNFAIIFAFCERFGDSCGVTIPTFQELQEMLENTTEVPDALVDLHIKLLRKVKKSVQVDKWERAVLKFCHEYSVPEFWELEHYGYKGISVKLKLRILKTLFEAQFDSNVKFKSEVNKLESSTLHSQPLGWDRSGVAYWVQFDRACNLRVYKEDIDEDTWKIVAKDRSTLVNLINELSGAKDNTLDDIEDSNSIETGSDGSDGLFSNRNSEKQSPMLTNIAPIIEDDKIECCTTKSTNIELEANEYDPIENPLESINFKRKFIEDDNSSNNSNIIPIVGEEIEESVMIVKGEGSGQECDTGNPDETNTQNDTLKTEDVKKPKLWSIETICSSSKEVKEEIVSVPKTGFFFGDDSVPCFNNVSNGKDSSIGENKLEVVSSNKNIEEDSNKNKTLDEVDTTTPHSIKSLNIDEISSKNASKQSVFNIKVHEEEVQITERKANEVFTKSESSKLHNSSNVCSSTSLDSYSKPQESQINSTTENVVSNVVTCKNQPQISFKTNKCDTDHKVECNKIKVDEINDLPKNLTNSDIHIGKTIKEQENLSVKSEDNTKCNINQQLEENKKKGKDQQLEGNMKNEKNQHLEENIKTENEHLLEENIENENDQQLEKNKKKENDQKLEENIKGIKDQQLEDDKQSKSNIVGELIKIDKNIYDHTIQSNEQLISKINKCDDDKSIDNSCENIISNESFANTVGQYADINDQPSIDVIKQNSSILDTTLSKVDDQSILINNQILDNKCTIIENEEPLNNLAKDEPEQLFKHTKHVQNTDDLETNSNSSNNDNSIINVPACSSKACDQTLTGNVDQCPQTFKKVIGNQNNSKSKKKPHNISNIIDTDVILIKNIVGAKEQSINSGDIDFEEPGHFQIADEKNEKKTSVAIVDSSNVFNNKHSLNKILQKLDDNKEISECPNSESSNLDLEVKKVGIVKSEIEINMEESNLKNNDVVKELTAIKNDKFTENEDNISLIKSSVLENQKEIIDVINKETKSDKDYVVSTNTMDQCKTDEIKQENLDVNHAEIKQNDAKKEKHKLFNVKYNTDTDICNKDKFNLEEFKSGTCNNDNPVYDLSVQKSILKAESSMDFVEDNTVDILNSDKNVINKSIEIYKNLENDEKQQRNSNKDKIEQNLKINSEDPDEEDILTPSEELIVTSPVREDVYENADEINQETLQTTKDEFDDRVDVAHTFEDDSNKSEEEEVADETPKKKGRPGRKKGKRGRAKKIIPAKQDSKTTTEEKVKRPYKPRQKKVVTISEEVTVFPEPVGDDNVRRSRRIAEIKIKEQFIPSTQYDDIDIPLKSPKKKDKGGKKGSTPSKKLENAEESDDEDEDDPISKKFKKRRRKGKSDSLKKINMINPWNVDSESSSSENNVELFEDYDHEEEEEIPRPGIEPNISDHEFSPESDINDEDEEYLPEKRARTAHKKDEGEQLKDDMCQKCNKSDQPEWILLCDTCNQGWHASCLRPPLMVIPDGDWYCPPCHHEALLNALKETLKRYDSESKKRENEELRRKRLAYVGISLQNVISSKTEEVKSEKLPVVHQSSEDDDDESESEEYDSEPLYTLRARRQANVSYRFNDYDDMINEAILEETGVDESGAKRSTEAKTDRNDNDENNDSDNDENEKDREDSPIAPALLHLRGRKKSKKLTNLDISSDDGSDEDFKGPSDEDDDYEEDLSEYSDDSVKRRPQPTRRSVRNRKNVVDPDFINDDSSEDSDQRSKKKKRSRPWSDSSNSEEEDLTWGKKKKRRTNAYSSSSLMSKGSKRKRSENDSARKLKKSKVKFGMNSDSDSDGQPKRRTRGRQITYAESDDSEEEVQTKKRKVESDDEDEYVLNDEELEVENEDQTLEVDEDDAMASNDEKDEEDDVDEEEAVDEEEEDNDEDEEVNPKLAITSSAPALSNVAHPTVVELPPPSDIAKSVIREPVPSSSSDPVAVEPHHSAHPRLIPPAVVQPKEKQALPPVVDSEQGSLDKRKRPQHQPKKCPSPNPLVDYGGGAGYPYAPDATKVAVSTVLPSPAHVAYIRPSAAVSVAAGVFKTMVPRTAGDIGFPVVSAPYRTGANKMTGPASYLPPPPQVQQVYQAPTPQSQPSSTSYSPYPIDYAVTGTPLPPPPPTIAFRNVVIAPPSHEHAVLPSSTQQHQQQSATGGGDTEFGGLVSYFSSQQEDDFDA